MGTGRPCPVKVHASAVEEQEWQLVMLLAPRLRAFAALQLQ